MSESLIAYLLGPTVMLIVGAIIWASSRYHRPTRPPRIERWLDTHYSEWLHHRH